MNDLRDALQQIADLLTVTRQRVYIEQLAGGSAVRLNGLNLIGLYLGAAAAAVRGALDIARRI